MRTARTAALLAVVAATALCTACVPERVDTGARQTPAETVSPSPTETSDDDLLDGIDIGEEPVEYPPLAEGEVDVTAEVVDVASAIVTRAIFDGETLRVETWLEDPRGADGSPEAQEAIEVCQDAQSLGYDRVYVSEDDGSTFVVAGHSEYGPECTEV